MNKISKNINEYFWRYVGVVPGFDLTFGSENMDIMYPRERNCYLTIIFRVKKADL